MSFKNRIKPPSNDYSQHCIEVHGITAADTATAPTFAEVYAELEAHLHGKTVVAHNVAFDKSVLKECMKQAGLDYAALDIDDKWQCTLHIYRSKGYKPCNLNVCCDALGITLNHHQALSDAQACAELFLRR